ncbi:MAG: hypothetical protein MK439_08515 [SAR324 cluster bacterium]|nr:hypothetical protein [SAR324 cluster bacterium]
MLFLVSGGLHAWLYLRRAQEHIFKYNSRWPARDSRKFLWKDQVKDNMFWSLISGCSFWTLFEALTHWHRASGIQEFPEMF